MSTNSVDSKAERLAQARKKLRDYQAKQHGNVDDTSSPSPSNTSVNNNGRHSVASLRLSNHDDKRSPFERIRRASQSSLSSAAHSVVNIDGPKNMPLGPDANGIAVNDVSEMVGSNEISMRSNSVADVKVPHEVSERVEYDRVVDELRRCVAEKEQITSQYTELTKHYSEIYAAYTKLSESLKSESPVDSALQTQLLHLQTAMSVVVQEKTALQQQLREAKELAEERQHQMSNVMIDLNEKTSQIFEFENEIASSKKKVEKLNEIVRRQKDELDDGRKEAAAWQARVLRTQQDRNDAQERLRVCMKEAEAAYSELEEARKQLKMKDLYLRQLGAYSSGDASSEHEFHNLHDENERLKEELNKMKTDFERMRKEAQAAREHYEKYGTELNQNVLQLSTKLEELSREKMCLQEELQRMEFRLEAQKDREAAQRGGEQSSAVIRNFNENMKMQTANDENEQMKQLARANEELTNEIAAKDKDLRDMAAGFGVLKTELATKMEELETVKKALNKARSEIEERQRYTEDALSLSEQLQNEKATVSRAIAQNHELKDQLIELQDKLVTVTQESLDRENARLSALHMVSQLQNELSRLKMRSEVNANSQSDEESKAVMNSVNENKGAEPFCRVSTDYDEEGAHSANFREHDETSSTSSTSESNDRDALLSRVEEARIRAEAELTNAKLAYEQLSVEHRRVAQENDELRRIMEQNSEDENQNSIHVELGQAIERINALSAENEQLRSEISEYRDAAQHRIANGTLTPEISHSSNASLPDRSDSRILETPLLEEKPLAWTELEARFARAMRQNADLIEEKERLEHIVMQLETENDTIGDYVTIYQHQRKMLKERMHERENAVAKLSLEKEQMQQKLNELQSSLMIVLAKKGIIHTNALGPSFADVHNVFGNSQYGLHENLNNVQDSNSQQMGRTPSPDNVYVNDKRHSTASGMATPQDNTGQSENEQNDDVGVQRVLNLINELQNLERARSLPPFDPNMHCVECRGKMINL